MVTSLFLRHFKIYKGIRFIPLSEGVGFSSLIGENGVGKSSVFEALDYTLNRKSISDWPINNEAKSEGGLGGANIPFIAPVFLIHKDKLRNSRKDEVELFKKAEKLSSFLWNTKIKTKSKSLEDFYAHRQELKKVYDQKEYFLLLVGRKYNEVGIYFGSYHNYLDFVNTNSAIQHTEEELQSYFRGFYDYVVSHYSFLYIPVETDVHTYTKLETQEMQKLMDRNIQTEIEKAIKPSILKQINKDLDAFVQDVENVLEIYQYKGHFKNSLTMPDLFLKLLKLIFQ